MVEFTEHNRDMKTMQAKNEKSSELNTQDTTFEIPLPAGKSLLPFQQQHVQRMLKILTTNTTNSYYNADEMGLGKSIQAIACVNALHAKRVLILCPAVMRFVWRDEISKWATFTKGGLCTDVILSSKDATLIDTAPSNFGSYTICSYDLAHRKNILEALLKTKFDVLIMDEAHYCVAPWTKVQSERGNIPISQLHIGDNVWSSSDNGLRLNPITNIIYGDVTEEAFQIELENGSYLECLGWHLVRLDNGTWKEAQRLTVSDRVSVVQKDVLCLLPKSSESKILQSEMCKDSSLCNSMVRTHETAQSDEKQGISIKNESNPKENTSQTAYSGREWQGDAGTTETISSSSQGVLSSIQRDSRVSSKPICTRKTSKRLPDLLQNRLRDSGENDSNRSRWDVTSSTKSKETGQKERPQITSTRVVRVTSYKRRSTNSDAENFIDLEIARDHNYIANGVVVHNCKNRKALRTKAVLKHLWDNAKYHIALSGTPFTTRIVDGFTLFNKMLPEAFPNFFSFAEAFSYSTEKWFSGRKVTDYYGVKNPELLSKIIRKHFYGRHTKSEVLQDLPAKQFTQITLPIQYAVKIKSRTEQEELEAQAEMVRRAIENDTTVPPLPAHIARHRAAQGIAKLPAVVEFVADLLENGVPVVLFGWHTDFLRQLNTAFDAYSPSLIDGSINSKDRFEQVRRFQAGETNLFIGQYIAAGVGITLTRSSTVVLGELEWSPANISQAIDRTHRIGQKNAVQIFYFVVERSLDESISNTVMSRSRDFKSVLEYKNEN